MKATIVLIAAAVSHPGVTAAIPASVPPPSEIQTIPESPYNRVQSSVNTPTASWEIALCSQTDIANPAANPGDRWIAADADDAWSAVIESWNEGTPSGDVPLVFSAFVSNFFNGPENWHCESLLDTPCSTSVQCNQVNHPAGFLILNSFSNIHEIHKQYQAAIQQAAISALANVGQLASTFLPQASDDTTFIKELFAGFTSLISAGITYAFYIHIKPIWYAAYPNYQDWLWAIAGSMSAASSFTWSTGGNMLPAVTSALDSQNSMSSALGALFTSWESSEDIMMQNLFNGSDSSIQNLQAQMQAGLMTAIPANLDLSGMVAEAETLLYAQLILNAWTETYNPFILQTGDTCSSTPPTPPMEMNTYLDSDTASNTGVCYQGSIYYVLGIDPNSADYQFMDQNAPGGSPFVPLPGGTNDVLDGTAWGGITLSDMVASAAGAYALNNNQNGYQIPGPSSNPSDLTYQNGISTPGYFSFPVCTNLRRTIINIGAGKQDSGLTYWPCS